MGLYAFGRSMEYEWIQWINRFQAEIADSTDAYWLMAFRNEAEAIIGISADEFGRHKLDVTNNF